MRLYLEILAGVLPGLFIVLIIIVWCRVYCRGRRQQTTLHPAIEQPAQREDVEKGLGRYTSRINSNALSSKSSLRFHQLYHDAIAPVEPQEITSFCWTQHPELITEATENGWSRFAFNDMMYRRGSGSWEAPPGSSELMQAVRLNPADTRGGSSTNNGDYSNLLSGVRMRLPLPGPILNGLPFPQEAYFEVTIIYLKPHEEHRHKWYVRASKRAKEQVEGDRSRLIESGSNKVDDAIKAIREQVTEKNKDEEEEKEEKEGKKKGHKNKHVVISMGLSAEMHMSKPGLPGMYLGSIGFHSDGSVYLDGMKLAIESDKKAWGDRERVIGCGFDPAKKKVFFTLDSKMVHSISCNSQTYTAPLFPVLASNTDTMLLVNLGQAKFQYRPANAKRTPNPCFLRPNNTDTDTSNTGFGCDDDSGELFSVGWVDSCWSRANSITYSGPLQNDGVTAPTDFDRDDADFFEIPLKDC